MFVIVKTKQICQGLRFKISGNMKVSGSEKTSVKVSLENVKFLQIYTSLKKKKYTIWASVFTVTYPG